MKASKLYFRELLGLTLVGFAVLVMLGIITCALALLNYLSHDTAQAIAFLKEAITMFLFIIPAIAIGKYINKPSWVHDVDEYRLAMEKKAQ
ncbi:D-fructose-6-phosphate amidotransferase [Photobacterium damselae]|uniref:D-fructose-6-phosphate amidotransferase n=1 Tax=Photobacterium damselae TaxID=38293 RepID=UPI002542ADC0